MNCQEVMELMQRQLDDDLSDAELEVLMNHTRQCPDCAAMFDRMKRLSAELTALPKVMPSYSLVDAILPELERLDAIHEAKEAPQPDVEKSLQPSELSRSNRRAKRKRAWPTLSAIGSVVAAGVVAGLFLMNNPPQGDDDSSLANKVQYSVAEMGLGNTAAQDTTSDIMYDKSELDPDAELEMKSFVRKTDEGVAVPNPDAGGDVSVGLTNGGGSAPTSPGAGEQLEVQDQYGGESFNKELTGEEEDSSVNDGNESDHEEGNMGIAAIHDYASPDGKYSAHVESHRIIIVSAEDGQTIMETSRKNGRHAAVQWSENSAELTYEVQLDQGAIEKYVIDTAHWREKKAAH